MRSIQKNPPLVVISVVIVLLSTSLTFVASGEAVAKDNTSQNDASLIAAWLTGSDTAAQAFERRFGDADFLAKAKDAIFYSDVEAVQVPKVLRRVPYDFLKPRLELIRTGHPCDPAVLVTQSIADDPREGVLARRQESAPRRPMPGERYYYIEVAIGNMAWHWMKVAVYEVEGKPHVSILWSKVS